MVDKKLGVNTYKEIASQPESWSVTIEQFEKSKFKQKISKENYEHVIFTGCGSTYYLSIWAARLCQAITGISSRPLPASELWYATNSWLKPYQKILLVPISRSGETTETIKAIEKFKSKEKGTTFGITCYPKSSLAKSVDNFLATPSGQETSIAQTMSFTNMMLAVLFLINGDIPSGLGKTIKNSSQRFINEYLEKITGLAENLEIDRFFFLGNGPLYGIACELMLKMKEMSLSYSEAFHFLEFRHGPMSMVNRNSLILGLSNSETYEIEKNVLLDMQDLGAKVVNIQNSGLKKKNSPFFMEATIPKKIPEYWKHPLYLPLIQNLAYERAIQKGLNPDEPNNLSAVVELKI